MSLNFVTEFSFPPTRFERKDKTVLKRFTTNERPKIHRNSYGQELHFKTRVRKYTQDEITNELLHQRQMPLNPTEWISNKTIVRYRVSVQKRAKNQIYF